MLRGSMTDVVKAEELAIDVVRTDEGEELGGVFQAVLSQHTIRHELTSPCKLQYNQVVAETALGLLQEKAMPLCEGSLEAQDQNV